MQKLIILVLLAFCIGCQEKNETQSNEPAATATENAAPAPAAITEKADSSRLAGEWIRTDAPYQLKIASVAAAGELQAAYFNPKPIHVGKANWVGNGGILQVYVELQDVNYPGSNYTLQYVPGKDLLAGKYFQAVEGTTYEVEFIRTK